MIQSAVPEPIIVLEEFVCQAIHGDALSRLPRRIESAELAAKRLSSAARNKLAVAVHLFESHQYDAARDAAEAAVRLFEKSNDSSGTELATCYLSKCIAAWDQNRLAPAP